MKSIVPGVLFLCSATALACDGLEVRDAWVAEAPPGAAVMAAYFEVANRSRVTLRLDRVSSPQFGGAMLHRSELRDGMTRMAHVSAIELAPGAGERLAPGALHVMLFDPVRPLRSGDVAELVLHCGPARLSTRAAVRRAPD